MKSYFVVFAALCVALTSAQTTTTTTAPSPTPAVGPAPGTLGASDVAGIPIGPTPTSSGGDDSSTSASTTPASVKPGAVGTAGTVAPSTGSFDEDALKSGSAKDDSLSDLGDQSSGSDDKSTSSSSGTKSVVTTPTPTPSSSASAKSVAVGSVATLAVLAISCLV